MASNITLSYFGPPEQKHVVKVPPMQTLSDTLQAAASKFKPALVPSQCTLQCNKKPVDLNTPFRLLNIPPGSKLEIIKALSSSQQGSSARETPINTQQAAAVASAAVAPAAAPGQPAAVVTTAQAAPTQPGHPAPATQTPQQQQHAAPPPVAAPGVAGTPAQPTAVPAGATAGGAAGAAAGTSSSAAAAAHAAGIAGPSRVQEGSSSATAAAGAAAPGPLASLGIQGQVYVFHQRTLEESAAAAPKPMDVDPPDDFFELTTEDLVRMQQQANEKKKHDVMFKSRAMREAEAAALAASLGPVRVRLHFPDATIVQATFESSQPLSAVQQLVTQMSVQAIGPALYLYTTPPKTVLKDLKATLYQLKLVPAAHLYVGCDVKKLKGPAAAEAVAGGSYPGPFLRPEVTALMSDSLPDQTPAQQQQHVEPAAAQQGDAVSAAEAQRLLAAAAAASRSEAGGSSRAAGAGGGGKAPKWLKMGK